MSDVTNVGTSTSIAELMAEAQKKAEVKKTDTLDKDAFLKLLVAQLKYQNPLEPTDPSQFMAQTAQFTMVEKLEQMEKQGAASALGNRLSTASALVGRVVSYTDSDGKAQSGLVSSARLDGDSTILRVGQVDVPVENVASIAPASATTS